MDYSSPLSSPPASSVLDGYESDRESDVDHAASIVLGEASSEIDLVLMSPEFTLPPPVLPQRAVRTSPSKSASPGPLPQNDIAETVAETATETVAQVDEAHDEQLGGEDAPSKVENEDDPISRNEPDNKPNDSIVVAEEIHSSPQYTANTFAVTRSPSPKPKRGQRRGGKGDKQKQETADTAGTADTEEAPVQRSRARLKKESKPTPPSRPPRKAASKTPATVVVDENDDKEQPQAEGAPEPADPTMPTVMTTTRSGRRVVQKHCGDDLSPPSAKRASTRTPAKTPTKPLAKTAAKASPSNSAAAAVMRRRKQAAARWHTDFVLANTRSPLAHFDLRTLLCQPEAWEALDGEERKEVLALLPPSAVMVDAGTEDARPDIASLKNDDNFRHDCARYRSDLQAGFYNKQWLAEAFEAHTMRAEGLFDAYVLEAFESSWGVTVPDELKPVSMRQNQGEAKEREEKEVEVKDVPKTSLKRSRPPSTKAEETTKTEVGNGDDDTTAEAKTTSQSSEQGSTEQTEATAETDRSPKRQKYGDDNNDDHDKNDVEATGDVQDPGHESQARFALILGSPVRGEEKVVEAKVEPTVEPIVEMTTGDTVKDGVGHPGEDTVEVTIDTVEDAPTVSAKRKASVDIIDAVDVPMRSRKRMTPSVGITGEAHGQAGGGKLEEGIKVDE